MGEAQDVNYSKTAGQAFLQYLRLLARCVFVRVLAASGSLRRAKRGLCENGCSIILTFHRVLDDTSYRGTNSLPGILIRLRTFCEMVSYLSGQCELIHLADAVSNCSRSQKVRIACTFDDGWADNYATAFPVVRAAKVPITIFICPSLLDQSMPFWPERVVDLLAKDSRYSSSQIEDEIERLKTLAPEHRSYEIERIVNGTNASSDTELSGVDRTLSWAEVQEMERSGVRFGSHTSTHQILTMISDDQCRQELLHSKQLLEQVLAQPCLTFAYPNGNWTPEIRQAVAEAGFLLAVTTERGACTPLSDSLTLPRVNVCESNVVGLSGRFSPAMFEYTTLWKAWRAATRNRRVSADLLPRVKQPAHEPTRAQESYSAPGP